MTWGLVLRGRIGLPGGFRNARDFTIGCQFAEANAADSEESDETMTAAAQVAAVIYASWELRLFARGLRLKEVLEFLLLAVDDRFTSHRGQKRRCSHSWLRSWGIVE